MGQSRGAGKRGAAKKPPPLPKLLENTEEGHAQPRSLHSAPLPSAASPPSPPSPEPSLAAGSSPGPPSAGLAALPPPSPARTGPPRSSSVHLKWLLPKGGEVVPGPRPVTHRGAGLGSARLSSARHAPGGGRLTAGLGPQVAATTPGFGARCAPPGRCGLGALLGPHMCPGTRAKLFLAPQLARPCPQSRVFASRPASATLMTHKMSHSHFCLVPTTVLTLNPPKNKT